MAARADIISLAATVALGATLAAGACTESIGARSALTTGPALSPPYGLEGMVLLKSGGWGASKGETVVEVGPRFIRFDATTRSWVGGMRVGLERSLWRKKLC